MSDFVFNSAKEYIADGTIDLDGHAFKIAIFTDAALPAAGDYSTYAALAAAKTEVANGNGYTTGGKALTGVTWNRAAGTVTFDAEDAAWPASTFTGRWAVIYDDTPTDPADPLLNLIDFGENKSVSANTFTIEFHEDGIFTLS